MSLFSRAHDILAAKANEALDSVENPNEQLDYDYLGNWEYRDGNSNVEVSLLEQNLRARGYDDNLITRALDQLSRAKAVGGSQNLYEANRAVYDLLRYGVKVRPGVGEQT